MNTTHTPGPWIVARIIPQDGDFIRQVKAEDGPVCFVHDLSDCQQEAKANARLIAAAPDLLAACKRISKALRNAPHETQNAYQGIWTDIDAAIAQAEGTA